MRYFTTFLIILFFGLGCSPIEVRKEYYPDGSLKHVQSYILGVANGYSIDYYDDGTTISDSCSIKEGKKNGICKQFHQNGQLKSRCNYVNGLIEGPFKSFNEQGEPDIMAYYKNGMLNGKKDEYDMQGKLWRESSYNNDTLDGTTSDYYGNGVPRCNTLFKHGMIMQMEYTYRDGKTRMLVYYEGGAEYSRKRYDEDGVELAPSAYIVKLKDGKENIPVGGVMEARINFLAQDIKDMKDKHVFIGSLNDDDSLENAENKELPLIDNTYAMLRVNVGSSTGPRSLSGALRYTKPNGRVVYVPFFVKWTVGSQE